MLLRFCLVALVTSLGVTPPSSDQVQNWTRAGRTWIAARLDDLRGAPVVVKSAEDKADAAFERVVGEMKRDFTNDLALLDSLHKGESLPFESTTVADNALSSLESLASQTVGEKGLMTELVGPPATLAVVQYEPVGPPASLAVVQYELVGPPSKLAVVRNELVGPPADLMIVRNELIGPPQELMLALNELVGPPSELVPVRHELVGPPADLAVVSAPETEPAVAPSGRATRLISAVRLTRQAAQAWVTLLQDGEGASIRR